MGKTNFGNPYGQSGAKGVLSEISIDSYTFATTNQGTNYQKLETYGNNISNHSYGINLGWPMQVLQVQPTHKLDFIGLVIMI